MLLKIRRWIRRAVFGATASADGGQRVADRNQPGPPPRGVLPSNEQKQVLLHRARSTAEPHRTVLRAKIILALYLNPNVAAAARELGVSENTVRKWRDRFLEQGLPGLEDAERSGRPPTIDSVSRCQVIAMACAKPANYGVEYRDVWTMDSLTEAYHQHHPDLCTMSRSSVQRILSGGDLRPHKMDVWLHSPDPQFREKVADICDLYLNPLDNAVVLCVDEKPGIQALGRKHPTKQAAVGRNGRFEFEYKRNGTRKLIAAFNPHTGEVYGEMRETRKAQDLVEFMEAVAKQHPHGDVHIVWDNLNIHYDGKDKRWTRFNKRHGGRFHFHYTPIHASWVNQIELLFSILQRRVLRYGEFDSLEELDEVVIGFLEHWNTHECKPFRWTFTGYPLQTGDKKRA